MIRSCLFAFVIMMAAGCGLPDEDRCPGGYTYNPDKLACEKNETGDSQAGSDNASDTATDSIGDDTPTGIGQECADNDDCADFEADVCAVNPMTKVGYCTIVDCSPGECPSGYQCCTCAGEDKTRDICLTDTQAGLATQVGTCSSCG